MSLLSSDERISNQASDAVVTNGPLCHYQVMRECQTDLYVTTKLYDSDKRTAMSLPSHAVVTNVPLCYEQVMR